MKHCQIFGNQETATSLANSSSPTSSVLTKRSCGWRLTARHPATRVSEDQMLAFKRPCPSLVDMGAKCFTPLDSPWTKTWSTHTRIPEASQLLQHSFCMASVWHKWASWSSISMGLANSFPPMHLRSEQQRLNHELRQLLASGQVQGCWASPLSHQTVQKPTKKKNALSPVKNAFSSVKNAFSNSGFGMPKTHRFPWFPCLLVEAPKPFHRDIMSDIWPPLFW